jgi:hypothetical protein
MAQATSRRSTRGGRVSWRDIQIERDRTLLIDYTPRMQHGPVIERASTIRWQPAPIPGVVFSQIVIVGGKVRLVETSERPNYDARHMREITAPFVGCLATA